MASGRSVRMTRRQAVLASVAAGALAAVGPVGGSVPHAAAQRSMSGGGGIAGGGVGKTPQGRVQFSLFASRLEVRGEQEPLVFGKVQWVDPNWRSKG